MSSLQDEVTVQENTVSMRLKNVVYVSKHRFREFTEQTWTSLLFDLNSVTSIWCDASSEFLLVDSACTTKITSLGGNRKVAEGNASTESQHYWNPLCLFVYETGKNSN